MSVGDTQDQAPGAGPAPKKHPWRRRIKIFLLTVIVISFVLRITMIFALPLVLLRVGRFYGIDIKSTRQSLAIMGGQAALYNVKIYPKGGGDLLFAADYVHGEIIPWRLLTGKLHVLRAEADGVDLIVLRTSDGRIPLLEQLASRQTAPSKATSTPTQIDFTSPLNVEALRLNRVRAQICDDAVTPRLDTSFTMDLRVSHLGSPQGTPVEFEIDAYADRVLDSLRIDGTATASGKNLDAKAKLVMKGLHGKPLAGYLQPLGLKPVADSIAMEANATLKARPLPAPSQAVSASCAVDHIVVSADEQEFATLPMLKIDADRVDATGAQISNVEVEGGRFSGARDARYSAALFRWAAGNVEAATADYDAFLAKWPDDARVPGIQFDVVRMFQERAARQIRFVFTSDAHYGLTTRTHALTVRERLWNTATWGASATVSLTPPRLTHN